jgi:hypothetical protein
MHFEQGYLQAPHTIQNIIKKQATHLERLAFML